MNNRAPSAENTELKIVGKSGQISLGKRYAGKTLQVARNEDGTITLTPVAVIPESQAWVFQEPHWSRLQEGLEWAKANAPKETDLDEFVGRVEAGRKQVPNGRRARPRP